MQLEPNLDNPNTDGEAPLPEEGTAAPNRTFILLAIPLVIVFLCIAGGLGYYALVMAPQARHAKETQAAAIVAQNNTQIAIQTAGAVKPATPTLPPTLPPPSATPVPPTKTPAPTKTAQAGSLASPTPLLAVTASNTPEVTATSAVTATTAKTQASGGGASPTATKGGASKTATPLVGGLKTATPTQLPGTGFADEAGVPLLIVVTLSLVAVVVLVRRLRLSLR